MIHVLVEACRLQERRRMLPRTKPSGGSIFGRRAMASGSLLLDGETCMGKGPHLQVEPSGRKVVPANQPTSHRDGSP